MFLFLLMILQLQPLFLSEALTFVRNLIIEYPDPVSDPALLVQILRFAHPRTPSLSQSVSSYFRSHKNLLLTSGLTAATILWYVLAPTLFPSSYRQNAMFSKRPDKYTTGLINLRNDCFANSSLQAFASLPALTEYLNKFIGQCYDLKQFLVNGDYDLSDVDEIMRKKLEEINANSKFRHLKSKFEIPLHLSLAQIIKKLQATTMANQSISVWTFLHDLEAVFSAKISRSQHDAQELTQLIFETLENENMNCKRYLKLIRQYHHQDIQFELFDDFEEFPFSGLIMQQMTCLKCTNVSKPSFSPFLMLTLHTPQTLDVDLMTLLDKEAEESIEGYHCLRCRLAAIVNVESGLAPEKQSAFYPKIAEYNAIPNLPINQDLPKEVEKFIEQYNANGLNISTITLTVFRTLKILKPPRIFGIHLSRSNFNGVDVTRNQCRVHFEDGLTLSIGKQYTDKLKEYQGDITVDYPIHTSVLTTNPEEDEMKADTVQHVEETAETTPSTDDEDMDPLGKSKRVRSRRSTGASAKENGTDDVISVGSDEIQMDEEDELEILDAKHNFYNSPISKSQSDKLKELFQNFKFSNDDVYKYKLKSMIRHYGSHTMGHYECYRRKPIYAKDRDGNIFKLAPEVDSEVVVDMEKVANEENNDHSSNGVDPASAVTETSTPTPESPLSSSPQIRRRLSSIVGRRQSVFQAEIGGEVKHTPSRDGARSPTELVVGELDARPILSLGAVDKSLQEFSKTNVTLKKLPTSVKYPFWRISDGQVTEVPKSSVLCEHAAAYMLYYERSDTIM